MSRQHTVVRLLADHPRLRAATFALLLFASQAGLAAAGKGSAYPGP